MNFFTGDFESDKALLFFFLCDELDGSTTGTARREMYKKANKKMPKDAYSLTIGHTTRRYISPSKDREPSDIFEGLYKTKVLAEKPYIMHILNEFTNLYLPDFCYTEVQCNFNYSTPPHKDRGNLGKSYILGLGDYEGGELCIEREEGNIEKIDIRDDFYTFNGAKYYHWVAPVEGDRMSLVFYNTKRGKRINLQ